MAEREIPYSQFNFLVDLGEGTDGPKAGFQEVSGLNVEITTADYRRGNYPENSPQKITGTSKFGDVTLKRGVMGFDDLALWLEEVRTGSQTAARNITIQLLSEDRQAVAQTWLVSAARPTKYTAPTLNGTGTEVAVEEVVLACEKIEQQFE